LTSLIETSKYLQGMFWQVFHLSRYAVSNIKLTWITRIFKREVWYSFWRNQNYVANHNARARSALNLYECAVSQTLLND